jgi:hypothetical protein
MNPPRKKSPPEVRGVRQTPKAPPAYRPQPLQKCLQLKQAAPTSTRHEATPVRAPAPQPAVTRRAPTLAPSRPNVVAPKSRPQQQRAAHAREGAVQPTAAKRSARQTSPAPVVQATKLYPNLHPGAVERVEQDSVFKLSSFADQYRLRKTQSHGVYVPNQLYNFVRTSEGQTLLHNRYRHPSIAEGRQVLYAGEAYFNNGKLEWWSNGSGHYQPDSEDAQQAALPMDQFYSYQQVIKGEHKRKKA